MVDRIFKFLNLEWSGLHQAALLLGLSALTSQILGLVRDRLLAASFGAGTTLDVYYAAFRIPDFIFISVGSFISVVVLIPFLVGSREEGGNERAKKFLDSLFTVFLSVMVIVLAVAFILIPKLAPVVAPGFTGPLRAEYILLSRILLLSPLFLGLSNLLGSITQSFKKFLVYALSPLFYNVGIIIGILWFSKLWGSVGLVLGVILGAFFHFAIQLPTVAQMRLLPRLTRRINWGEVKEVALVSLPRTITLGASQLVILFFIALASLMKEGSIAIFNFSNNLQSVPLAIIGVSYAVAAFPTLAAAFTRGEEGKFVQSVSAAARNIIFWSVPVTVLFIVLRAQIVRTILGAGAFDWASTRLTAAALALFSLSVAGQGLVLLFVRCYHAVGKTRRPLVVNTLSSIVAGISAYALLALFDGYGGFRNFFEALFRVGDVPGTRVLMLPLAYSIGVFVNVLLYWIVFSRDFTPLRSLISRTLSQIFSASVLMGFASYGALIFFGHYFNLQTFAGIFLQGLLAGLVGILVGVILLLSMKNREFLDFLRALREKFGRVIPPVPSPDESVNP